MAVVLPVYRWDGLLLSREFWPPVRAQTRERIERRALLGQMEHPMDGRSRIRDATHLVEGLEEEDGVLKARIKFLDTAPGAMAERLLRLGLLRLSTRASGVRDPQTGQVDPSTLRIASFDLVSPGGKVSLLEVLALEVADAEREADRKLEL